MIEDFLGAIEQLQGVLFQGVFEPALYYLGLIDWSEDLYDGIGFAMFGAVEVVLAFFLYVVAIDFGEYWRHRLQHRLSWWWALHSVHHDQRQMTLWTDNRNHVLDDIVAAVWSGTIALMIGVPPAEYPLVMIAFR